MSDESTDMRIGRLTSKVEAMEEWRKSFESRFDKLIDTVQETHDAVVAAKGGYRVLAGVGAAAGVIASGATWLLAKAGAIATVLPR